MASIPTSGGIYRSSGSYGGSPVSNVVSTPTVSQTQYNTLKSQYDALNNNYNNLKNQYQYKQATADKSVFTMNVGGNQYTAAQQKYNPQATLTQVAQQNALTNPAQMSNININQPTAPNTNLNTPTINYRPNAQAVYSPYIKNTQLGNLGDINKSGLSSTASKAVYQPNIQSTNASAGNIQNFYDYTNLHNDIYKGIQTAVNQERELAQDRLNNTMANAGLYRSGLTLENQQQLERSTLDALAKGWGDTAYNVAQLQGNLAAQQAQLNTNVNLQNSINQLQASTRNAELAADLSKLNAQLQTDVGIQNAQNILQAKLTEYAQKADMLKAQGQLDQAAEFERAKNSLQAQLSNQQKDIELANLNTDIAKTQVGLFQQSNLATLDANMQKYKTQADLAKTQAALSLDISKYNADIQNAFKTKNYDYLMNAAAQDQDAVNQAAQYNIQIKNAYDEIAFKWMASLLDKEIREYQATMDALAKESAYTLQYGDAAAKQKLANLQIGQSLYNKLFS
jgi:hypothetical protein